MNLTHNRRSGQVPPIEGEIDPLPLQSARARSHGFDKLALGRFTLANPQPDVPPGFTIYRAPAGIAYAETQFIAVDADPAGIFLSSITWSFVLTGAGPQEYYQASTINDAGNTEETAGLRWALLGASLAEPFPYVIRLTPLQELQLRIKQSTAPNNTPMNITVRVMGRIFL